MRTIGVQFPHVIPGFPGRNGGIELEEPELERACDDRDVLLG